MDMKKKFALLAVFLTLAAPPGHGQTAVSEIGKTLATQAIDPKALPAGTVYGSIRNSPFVILRAEPKLESAPVATLLPEDKILVIGRQNDWVNVTTTKGTGWMRAWYFQEPSGGAATVSPGTALTSSSPTGVTSTSPAVPATFTPPSSSSSPPSGTTLVSDPVPATPTRISDPAPPTRIADPPKVEAPPATAKGPKALYGWLQAAGLSGENLKMAWAIAMGESGGNPRAFNGNRNTGDCSYGLFQINMIDNLGPARRKQFGISSNDELFDPMTNIKAMLKVSGNCTNWKPWSVYKNGTYKKFLSQYPPK